LHPGVGWNDQTRLIVGFEREIAFDDSSPDDTRRKLLDIGKIRILASKSKAG